MYPRFQIVHHARVTHRLAQNAARPGRQRVAKCLEALKRTKDRLLLPPAKLLRLRSPIRRVSYAAAAVFGLLALCAAPLRAQQPPPEAVGEVQGNDVTVEGGTAAMLGTSTNAPKMFVSNGSVLTVHSGTAVMTLFAGGEVDICGPAKITILRSSGAITLALNFGRMRVQLPPKTSLRVFTPSVIGTPLDISGGARDTTVGLNLDDSMCVLATSGAIQLANQFTDQTLIVPQSGEFFLSAGQLQPVAGKPGSCQCTAVKLQPPAAPPAQVAEFAQATPASAIALTPAPQVPADVAPLTAPPVAVPVPQFTQATPAAPAPRHTTDAPPMAPPAIADRPLAAVVPAPQPGEPAPPIEYSVPASVSEAHPVVPQGREAPASAPSGPAPEYTAVLPTLMFSASSPEPPGDLTPDMTLLIRVARVEPEWAFTGTVAAPEFVSAMRQSLGVEGAKQPPAADATAPPEKKRGFWSGLKRLFGGR
ncbi:MAG TPA: hypothetical protein VHX49_13970 [Candidatus Acidoferrales bacterium]|jgi:hypothetical protein|nr:hypothetical protein [Candidatus Acidoferrales bacterium]